MTVQRIIALAALPVTIGAVLTAPATAAPSASSIIKACVSKKTGAVRFVTAKRTCRPGERKVRINRRGVPGERGPSDAFVANRTDVKSLNQMQVGPNTLLSLTLPAGSYVLSAQTSVRTTTADTTISCGFVSAAGTVVASNGVSSSATFASVAVIGTYSSTSSGVVSLLCQPAAPMPTVGLGEAKGATMVAVQVARITGP